MSIEINFPFTNPANYTYDSGIVEIVGGKGKLKDQRPADSTFYADYNSNINGNWGNGVLAGTPVGGAAVSGGELDLAHDDIRYVDYDADGNADSQQTGCVRFKITPNWSASPITTQRFFTILEAHNSTFNQITILQHSGGFIFVYVNDWNNVLKISQSLGAWNPTAGTEYEFEFNYDLTSGATRLFIDGVQFGITMTPTCTRSASIALMRIGSGSAGAVTSNFKINDFLVYSTVQHTANYTPDWSTIPVTIYVKTNPTIEINSTFLMEGLDEFIETSTKPGSDNIKYVLKKGAVWYYESGGVFVLSDETYIQSTIAADIETNKAVFTTSIITFGVKLFLHSDDGSTTPEIDLLEINYDYAGETQDTVNKCIIWGYNKHSDSNSNGTADISPIKIQLLNDMVKYKTNIIIRNDLLTVIPNSTNGYWDAELIETVNMEGDQKYRFIFGSKNVDKSIPNEITKNFWDLV